MDKSHYYQLLRSVAMAALAACGDDADECTHVVTLKTSQVTISAADACQNVSAIPTVPSGGLYGIRPASCGELCGDARMNDCAVPGAYTEQFEALNGPPEPAREAPLPGLKCPDAGSPSLVLECSQVETRGSDHDGCPVAGRRPAGLDDAQRQGEGCVAAYLARAAHLEAASVLAFRSLAVELAAHGAPAQLIADCLEAAREETTHAQTMTALARARGATPADATMRPRALPSLLALALENDVEGVVRESYGAVQALVSAQRASAPDVRNAMAIIAVEESSHAALSGRIGAWLDTQLSPAERREVASARRAAIEQLRRTVEREPARALVTQLGVPSAALSRHLLEALENALWSMPRGSALPHEHLVS
jgi:hypothetical protein